MCGIFAYSGDRLDAQDIVITGLKQLEYRGYDSWGVACIPQEKNQTLLVEKHLGKIGAAESGDRRDSKTAIGHTRWATHGGVTLANCHPHLDIEAEIAVVHNGIIENADVLRKKLQSSGYVFLSDTDTEVSVYLLKEHMKTLGLVASARAAFAQLEGLNAFVVLHRPTQQLIAYRKGSPLAVTSSADGTFIASDAAALAEYSDKVLFLEDEEVLWCQKGKITLFAPHSTQEIAVRWEPLQYSVQDMEKGEYDHFLLKEIAEQPRVLQTLASNPSQIRNYAEELAESLVFVGCGSAYNAALLGSYFFAQHSHQRVQVFIGSEFEHWRDALSEDSFVTFVTQSGETIDLVEKAQYLKKTDKRFGVLVNRVGSTLERLSQHKLLLSAGPEQCVLATKSYMAMVAALYLLAQERVGNVAAGCKEVQAAAQAIPKLMQAGYTKKHLEPLIDMLCKQSHIHILGRGASYPLALEVALKIKEVTYIPTEGMAGGELKHGSIALIDEGAVCIVIILDEQEKQAILSNAQELKARGAFIIGVSPWADEVFDAFIPVPDCGELSVLPALVPLQLLAYRMALQLGNDPDKPRNLAKSVTVK